MTDSLVVSLAIQKARRRLAEGDFQKGEEIIRFPMTISFSELVRQFSVIIQTPFGLVSGLSDKRRTALIDAILDLSPFLKETLEYPVEVHPKKVREPDCKICLELTLICRKKNDFVIVWRHLNDEDIDLIQPPIAGESVELAVHNFCTGITDIVEATLSSRGIDSREFLDNPISG